MQDRIAHGRPACSKDYPPLPSPSTKYKCEMFWKLALRITPAPVKKEFPKIAIIKVREGVRKHTCYKKESGENKGWCQTGTLKTQWGVCSNSCKHVYSGNKKVKYLGDLRQ